MKRILNTLLFVTALLFGLQTRAAYDPTIQRWIQRDPIGEAGGLNLYRFVDNNPVNNVDPFGWAVFGSFDANGNFNISYFPPGWNNAQPVLPGTLMPNQTAMGNMLNFPAGYDDFDYQFLNQMMQSTDLYPYGNLSPSEIGEAYGRGYINGWDYPLNNYMTMKDATAQVLVAIAMEVPMGMPMPGRIPCPTSTASRSSFGQSYRTLYHYGDLEGGISPYRPLSTSPSSDLMHYNPGEQLYQFNVPQSLLNEWLGNESALEFNDLHQPSGIITPEIRILPPASGQMNQFMVK